MGFLSGEGNVSTGSASPTAGAVGRSSSSSGDIAGSAGIVQQASGLSSGDSSGTSGSLNPNAQASGVTAQNPNSPGAGNTSAMNSLINMKITSPQTANPVTDYASQLMSQQSGLNPTYNPTGTAGGGSLNSSGLIADAKQWLGTPYEYGGTSKSGVDCSGFTQAVYSSMGINIGRDTSAQLKSGQVVGMDGNYAADVQQLQPGDLIFYGQPGASGPNAHVVMYIGGGQVIQAGGSNVNITPLFQSASSNDPFLGVRRYGGGSNQGGGGQYSGGGNINSWISQAEAATGVNAAQWSQGLALIAQHESSDNPNAINNWDSNAKAGHPSQGLMQTIPSTFSQYVPQSLRGEGIDNPVANLAAAIEYIIARYGSISNVPGVRAVANGGSYVGY